MVGSVALPLSVGFW